MFLSQPGRAMWASYHWPPMTVSIESAMRSRDWSEKLMPSVPIEMPSLTPMVLNRMPTRPAASHALLDLVGRGRSRCMLQGLPSYQTLAMPTWGLFMSSSVRPVAIEHRLRGALDSGWVMRELNLLSWGMGILQYMKCSRDPGVRLSVFAR